MTRLAEKITSLVLCDNVAGSIRLIKNGVGVWIFPSFPSRDDVPGVVVAIADVSIKIVKGKRISVPYDNRVPNITWVLVE